MKRPILVITIGFILGIIMGLYIKNIALLIFINIFILMLKIIKMKKVSRVINLIFPYTFILTVILSSTIGFMYIIKLEKIYGQLYNNNFNGKFIGTVVSSKIDKEYYYRYKIKVENTKYKNYYIFFNVNKNYNRFFNFGDKIVFSGEFEAPVRARNYKGFDYREYLKTIKVFGTVKSDGNIKLVKSNNINIISRFANNAKEKIILNSRSILPENTCKIFLGILLGYTDEIDNDIKADFSNSSLSHLLAVSGMHISYIVLGLTYILTRLNIHKTINKIATSIFLIFFLYITGFTSSVVRAVVMGILFIMQSVFKRKNDISTSIAISALLMLIENPYRIKSIGFILSYLATIGIIVFTIKNNKNSKQLIKTSKKNIMIAKVKQLILISTYAQIVTLPITIYYFSSISLTFLIANLIAGNIIGIITIGGFILIIISFISINLASIYAKIYNLFLNILLKTTQIISKIPISKIYVVIPNIALIIIYYISIFLLIYYYKIKNKDNKRYLEKKIIKKVIHIKKYIKLNIKKIILFIIILSVIPLILRFIPKDLKIYFIDVGQGDSTLIVTPFGKKVMIDSGGSENSNSFNVGEKVLLPYLLNRKIRTLDYIVISHFDSDHCKGFESILKNIKVNNIVVSKQIYQSENFNNIIQIAKENRIRLIVVKAGDNIRFDKFTSLKILYPTNNLKFNDLNNNSILAKLNYKYINMLFTGDIEKEAEKYIVNNLSIDLKSEILKISHHGSNTSTTKEFLERVNPKIALIGVGEKNSFGHPSEEVIKRLKDVKATIYRTDKMGEISIIVDKKGIIKVKTFIE